MSQFIVSLVMLDHNTDHSLAVSNYRLGKFIQSQKNRQRHKHTIFSLTGSHTYGIPTNIFFACIHAVGVEILATVLVT